MNDTDINLTVTAGMSLYLLDLTPLPTFAGRRGWVARWNDRLVFWLLWRIGHARRVFFWSERGIVASGYWVPKMERRVVTIITDDHFLASHLLPPRE